MPNSVEIDKEKDKKIGSKNNQEDEDDNEPDIIKSKPNNHVDTSDEEEPVRKISNTH